MTDLNAKSYKTECYTPILSLTKLFEIDNIQTLLQKQTKIINEVEASLKTAILIINKKNLFES